MPPPQPTLPNRGPNNPVNHFPQAQAPWNRTHLQPSRRRAAIQTLCRTSGQHGVRMGQGGVRDAVRAGLGTLT